MPEVICLGESLIDFVSLEAGFSIADSPGFQKRAGGAPANVATGLANLGTEVGFIGRIGEDGFGTFLRNHLYNHGVETSHLISTSEANTTLAFVSLTSSGEREFLFYRSPGADQTLSPMDIDEDYVSSTKLLHCGSLSLTSQKPRKATMAAIEIAKRAGSLVSFDPNLRLSLWKNRREMKKFVLNTLKESDLLKVSEEELQILSGKEQLKEGAQTLLEKGPRMIIVTMGSEGCYFNNGSCEGKVDGFHVEVKDTTGAGDGFDAGFINSLLNMENERGLSRISEAELRKICRYSNAVAALTTRDYGATSAFPNREEIEDFIDEN